MKANMKLRTFSLLLDEEGALDSSEMDQALEGCEVLHVWEHFVPAERVWLVMVGYRVAATRRERGERERFRPRHTRTYVPSAEQGAQEARASDQLASRLDPQERAAYESLRAWRLALAQARKIGPHLILSNAQLVELVKRRPSTLNALGETKGIGEGKLKDFGQGLIHAIEEAWSNAQRVIVAELNSSDTSSDTSNEEA